MTTEATLITADGERIFATHWPALGAPEGRAGCEGRPCFVFVHGFTQHHRTEKASRIIEALREAGGVIGIDMRGHGRSSGISVLAKDEIHDVDAAVAWARRLGYASVVPIGFSLGGAVVIRHASEGAEPVETTVAVSAPAFWGYRGTPIMRWVHAGYVTRVGRSIIRAGRRTRVATPEAWPEPWPDTPAEAAAKIRTPLLVIHGDRDHYFPLEHPKVIEREAQLAGTEVEVWIEPGMGHAETATTPELVARVVAWVQARLGVRP